MLSQEMSLHLRAFTKALYVIVDEEDRFVVNFHEKMKKNEERVWVYNATTGIKNIAEVVEDWKAKKPAAPDQKIASINDALMKVYNDVPNGKAHHYLILDPDRWFQDAHVVRRILNILYQAHQDINSTKCLIFVNHRRNIPEKLQRYIEVVDETEISPEELMTTVTNLAAKLKVPELPENPTRLFAGLTSYEIESAMSLSVVSSRMKHHPQDVRVIEPEFVARYKRQQIRKSELVHLVNTEGISFSSVGGAQRFKAWAQERKACWTEEGQKFGLQPPRGVLLVGVHGCGKSLCSKALANEWGLPLVQFEMGRIRTSALGESEANLYRALRIVDSVAPCIMWVDEAEKSLSGSASSAQSDAGTTSRLLGILSTWTQESKAPVSIVMTANSLKNLPAEMVNRLDERFFFDLPSEEDRIDILKIHGKRMRQDMSKFNLAHLAEKSVSLVGREIEQVMESSLVKSFNSKKKGLDEEILLQQLERKPRLITTMGDEIKAILEWVGYDPSVDDGVRARLASDRRSEQFKLIK